VPHPTLSVIVVTHNAQELVAPCVEALLEQLVDGDELIVADNGSADGTVEEIRRVVPDATLLELPANHGYGHACNAAAALATGDLLLMLDVDAVTAPGFCEAIRRPAAEGRDWAAWMGLVTMDGGQRINTSGGEVHFTGISWAGEIGDPVDGRRLQPHEVGFASGVCLTTTRQAWQEQGGLPPEYFLYFDDVDYCLRVRLCGGRVGIEPDARVGHRYAFAKQHKWRLLERNRWATILRTYPGPLLALLAPALLATEAVLLGVAWREGWLLEKCLASADTGRALPRLLRERRRIQCRRRISALEFACHLTPELSSPYLGRAGRSSALRWLLQAYWRLVCATLRRTQL
jgi:GT2 family glycosyltransferase